MGYVYFFRKKRTRIVKLGWTQNLLQRYRQLRKEEGVALELVVLLRIPVGPFWGTSHDSLEQRLHRRLVRYRCCPTTGKTMFSRILGVSGYEGEWYNLGAKELERICGEGQKLLGPDIELEDEFLRFKGLLGR